MTSSSPSVSSISRESCGIRPLEARDNAALLQLVLDTLQEHQCIGPGFASADPELQDLHAYYTQPSDNPVAPLLANPTKERGYWVLEEVATGRILGGVGYGPLKGALPDEKICELQKFYFRPEVRGQGFGRQLLELVIQESQAAGYRTIYLETVTQMIGALSLYEKVGFRSLTSPLGATGHTSCSVFMSRPLNP
jgi:putative acetyltransferase